MIIGTHRDIARYAGSIPSTNEIEAFITGSEMPPFDKWVQINGRLKVIRLNTFNEAHTNFEYHKKNIDFHYVLKGHDNMLVAVGDAGLDAVKSYDSNDDYGLFEPREDVTIKLSAGQWICLLPGELHRNFFAEPTEKLVFKILVDG
jgi:uncharacterized protein, YhcH/YjgK/YiaL family